MKNTQEEMHNTRNKQLGKLKISEKELEVKLKEIGSYEQFYSIALFDILGFSNFVSTHGNKSILDLYNKLLEIIYTPDLEKAVPTPLSEDWKQGIYIANANGYVKVKHFSDTFIIYVNYLFHREPYWLATSKYDPYPLLLGEIGTEYCPVFYREHAIFLAFLETCMNFFCEAIIAGIPLRGCISSGFATMDSNKEIYIGKPLVEAARGEPARKSLGISFGRSFNNYHPVYNDYFIPFGDYFRDGDKSQYVSSMILDWPRHWRKLSAFNKYSLTDCIKKMNSNPRFSAYYDNAIKIVEFSESHERWYEEIDREGIRDINDYYKKTDEWFESVYSSPKE